MSTISPDHRAFELDSRHLQDAHRDVLIAVQRSLAERWEDDHPRIAVIDHDGAASIYVSTIRNLDPELRADIRARARQALAESTPLGLYANVVFLRREGP